mmetsp:Transcript_16590/g.28246  ORF Transcript_16590/g.28246 Transcript_16590/m.28246 type:complete len:86 (+) Transcript_16590:597-854(+)
MRLDIDNDGSVSVEDLKLSLVGLYDFLKNLDLLETTTIIKNRLYTDAIAFMQHELEENEKQKKLKGSQDEKMVGEAENGDQDKLD